MSRWWIIHLLPVVIWSHRYNWIQKALPASAARFFHSPTHRVLLLFHHQAQIRPVEMTVNDQLFPNPQSLGPSYKSPVMNNNSHLLPTAYRQLLTNISHQKSADIVFTTQRLRFLLSTYDSFKIAHQATWEIREPYNLYRNHSYCLKLSQKHYRLTHGWLLLRWW